MGRLFWKFFALVLLAQLAGIAAVGTVFWLTDRPLGPPDQFNAVEVGPAAASRPRLPPPMPLFFTMAASVLTAALLARYVATPIRSLRMAFDAVAEGDLTIRVAPLLGRRQDELADLGGEFDRMAERLLAATDAQRRLLHDVSHEMRSPLARMQAAVGLLRQRPAQLESTAARLEDEIGRIDRLVADLLQLSRLDSGELTEQEEDIDMQELVREVLDDANFEAQSAHQEVLWEYPLTATVFGRPELLHGAIENVVRNALKHAPQSARILIETEVDPDRHLYRLRVLDSGPGIAEDDLAGVFTPFFRGVNAGRTEGYGLGLAIARRSIEAHGGEIRARNRAEGGLSVEITLPLRAAQGAVESARAGKMR